jgi:hypothetical protein
MEFSMAETGEPQRPIGISAIQAGEVNLGVSGFRSPFNRSYPGFFAFRWRKV